MTETPDDSSYTITAAGMPVRRSPSRYAAQRRRGFGWLRFQAELERDFRHSFIELNAWRLRISHPCIIAAMLLFLLLDQQFGYQWQTPKGSWILLGLLVPLLIISTGATYLHKDWVFRQLVVVLASICFGVAMLWLTKVGRAQVPQYPYEPLLLITIYFYFLSGLLLSQAVFCSAVVWLGFIFCIADFSASGVGWYESFYLLLACLIGAIGAYFLEFHQRNGFLLENEMRMMAQTDSLTGVMNRSAFSDQYERAWQQATRQGCAIGLLILDMDHFKHINDRHGHLMGDQILMLLGRLLRERGRRPLDLAARYGGDEFVSMFYDVEAAWFHQLAGELRSEFAEQAAAILPGGALASVSIGGCLISPQRTQEPRDALRYADEKLYAAKQAGRNQVQIQVLTPTR